MVAKPTPNDSDDEFDLVPDADAVSDMSDEDAETHRRAPPSHGTGAGRLAGPHEVPQMPFDYDAGVASIAQRLSDHKIEGSRRDAGSSKGSGNFINNGLMYTKSVYNKMLHKDALIAVMGYGILITAPSLFGTFSRLTSS